MKMVWKLWVLGMAAFSLPSQAQEFGGSIDALPQISQGVEAHIGSINQGAGGPSVPQSAEEGQIESLMERMRNGELEIIDLETIGGEVEEKNLSVWTLKGEMSNPQSPTQVMKQLGPDLWQTLTPMEQMLLWDGEDPEIYELNQRLITDGIANIDQDYFMTIPGFDIVGLPPPDHPPMGNSATGGIGYPLSDGSFLELANVRAGPPEYLVPFDDAPDYAGYRYWVNGFSDIVAVRRPKTVREEDKRCAAILLSDRHALTAAHCLADSADDLWRRIETGLTSSHPKWTNIRLKEKYRLKLIINKGVGQTQSEPGKPNSAGAIARYVTDVALPFTTTEISNAGFLGALWPNGTVGRARRDLALLTLRDPVNLSCGPTTCISAATLDTQGNANFERISFGGYGPSLHVIENELMSSEYWVRNLLVVGNWLDTWQNPYFYKWQTNHDRGSGGPCRGDSGTAMLADWKHGHIGEEHLVVGIVVVGYLADTKQDCSVQRGYALKTAPFSEALCHMTNDQIKGCSGS